MTETPPGGPRCGVVVVNWCSAEDTIQCCRAVLGSDYPITTLIVHDNASPDGSFKQILDALVGEARVRVQRSRDNLGYAGANNLGLDACFAAGCDCVLILNNDTLVHCEAIGRMVDYLYAHARIGIAGALLVDYEDNERIQCLGGATFQPWLLRTRNVGEGLRLAECARRRDVVKARIDYVSGACSLVRREFVEQVGGMREDFFLYCEELDWALRAREHGWGSGFCEHAIVRHRWTPDAVGKRERANFYFVRNGLTLLSEHQRAALPVAVLFQVARSAALVLKGRRRDGTAVLAGIGAFLRGNKGARVA